MAARDARLLREDAAAAAAAGKYKRALECYLELERTEPTDAQWPKRGAEMLRRLGKMKEAIASYDRAADRYTQGGFLVQAIAVCKLILQLDPSHVSTQIRLSAINEQQGTSSTRIGHLVESNTSLHDNPAVAALREGLGTRPPPMSNDYGTRAPPMGAASNRTPTLPPPRSKVPSDPPFRMPRTRTPSDPMTRARVPTPTELHRLADGTGRGDDDVTPRTRTGNEIRRRGRNKITTPPFQLAHGAAIDQVPLAQVMPGAHQLRDDGSQPGIQVIPLHDSADDDDPDIESDYGHEGDGDYDDVAIISAPAPAVDLSTADHAMEATDLYESEELDLSDLDEAPLPRPRLLGAQARRALSYTPLFAGLPMEQLEALITELEVLSLPVGTVVFREGDPGDALFIVSEGEVSISSEGPPRVEMSRVGAGGFFGEVSLVTEGPRAATVTAIAPTELLKIDRGAMSAVIGEHPDVLRVVLRFVRDRLVERLVRTSPLFRPFEEAERLALTDRFRFLEIDAGATILMAGQRSDGLYIVLAGKVEVHRGDGTRVVLGPGDLLGETSLLTGERITSPVVATSKCLALCLPAEEFRELIMTHPHILEYVGEQVERRRKVRMI